MPSGIKESAGTKDDVVIEVVVHIIHSLMLYPPVDGVCDSVKDIWG